MRALCLGALAVVSTLALAGCSHQPPPQATLPCVDESGRACVQVPPVDQPKLPEAAAKVTRKAAVARRAAHQRKHARAAQKQTPAKVVVATPVQKPRDKRPEPLPPADGASAPVVKIPSPVTANPSSPAKIQSEVTLAAVKVAAELAERMTALRVPEVPADTRLVAVLLARPMVNAVSDLAGKVIAIDERYAKSNAKITAAINAAGAAEVLLLEGQATAITRLSNGEVNAAVVALASPEAAEAFPKIAGFRLFTLALKP